MSFTIKFITFLLIIFLLNSFSNVKAAEQKLLTEQELNSIGFSKYESINPDSLLYSFKRLGEQIQIFFIFNNNEKMRYPLKLLSTRFNELVYTVNLQKTGFLTEIVSRYNTQIGKIKRDFKNIDSADKDKLIQKIKILEVLRDRYPANSSYWLSIQQAIDTTRSLL